MEEQIPHEQLKKLLEAIERETIPFPEHSDPKAINDCWRLAHDLIEEMINHCSKLKRQQPGESFDDFCKRTGHIVKLETIKALTEQVQNLKQQIENMKTPFMKGYELGLKDKINRLEKENFRLREERKELVEVLKVAEYHFRFDVKMSVTHAKIKSLLSKFEVPNQS